MSLFSYLTPATYVVSLILWLFVAVFYFQRRRLAQEQGRSLLNILLLVLMIDAGRTIFESGFFGAWYSARIGFLPAALYDFLVQPHIVFIPKAVNVCAALAVITIILRRWLPEEDAESRAQRRRADELERAVQARTQELVAANAALQDDVARRERVEQELRESEARFRDVSEASPSWIWETDADGVYTFASPKVLSVLGYAPQEVVGRSAHEFVEPREHEESALSTPSPKPHDHSVSQQEVWARTQQGDRVCLIRSYTALWDESGALAGFRGVDQNLTERKQAEERLRKQMVTFESLFEAIPDAILLTDRDRRITAVNQGFTNTFGYDLSEVKGQPTSVIYESEDEFRRQGRERYHLAADQLSKPYLVTYQHKDGRLLPGETIGTKVVTQDGEVLGFFGLIRDISERQAQERSILEMQKMQAIGTLSGGIAHDFNNILGSVVGYAELMQMEAPEDSVYAEYSNEILTAARRATDLVAQILTFARRRDESKTQIQIQSVVREAMGLLRRTIPTTIHIKLDLADSDDVVFADATQMHQVVMNLCTNAYYAMRDQGGSLTVSVACVELSAQDVQVVERFKDTTPGPCVRLTVADTGPGMSAETVAKVFEPFFTTKPSGEGTGIGMAVVHGIVRNHHGAIRIDSVVGEGTQVHVFLPRSKAVGHEAPPREASPEQGHGRILVVDDEPTIAKVVAALVKRAGYEADFFTSSVAALAQLRKDPDYYDLMIADQTMPEMTGDQLAEALHALRPNIPVIICTGYSHVISSARARQVGVRALLTKPVPSSTLISAVQQALAGLNSEQDKAP